MPPSSISRAVERHQIAKAIGSRGTWLMGIAAIGAAAGVASAGVGIANAIGGSSPSGSTTSTQTNTPFQAPWLTQGLNSANNLFYGTKPASQWSVGGQNFTSQADAQAYASAHPGGDGTAPQITDNSVANQFGFGSYNPTYYPGQTVAGFTPQQQLAQARIFGQAMSGEPITGAAQGYATGLENGNYLNSNPSSAYLTNIINNSINGNSANSLAAQGISQANGPLSQIANGNSPLSYLSSGIPTNASMLPGSGSLASFANGDMLSAGNPYFSSLASSLGASVVPQIQAQFINGGNMSNPSAAYATSQGLASALAPYMEQNYTSGQSNMLSAANSLNSNQLTGLGLQSQAASNLGGLQTTAANDIGQLALGQGTLANSAFLGGLSAQNQAAAQMGNQYQNTLSQMTQGLGLAPQTQQLSYNDMNALFNSGAQGQQQNQSQINADISKYNYNQQLPLNMLQSYLGLANGNFGSTQTLNQPYFSNPLANGLASALGGAQLGMGTYKALSDLFPQQPPAPTVSYTGSFDNSSGFGVA